MSFMEMALEDHLRLWSAAPAKLLTQSRYAALLVSMHGTALYEMRDLSKLSETDANAVRGYLSAQRELQERLSEGLDADQVRRNQGLLWIWDFLSLGLCLRWHGRSIEEVRMCSRAASVRRTPSFRGLWKRATSISDSESWVGRIKPWRTRSLFRTWSITE